MIRYAKLLILLPFIISCSGGAGDDLISVITNPILVSPPTSASSSASVMTGALPQSSPTILWTNPASFDHIEIALGTTVGGDETIAFTDIGTSTSHSFSGLTGLTECIDYYPNIKALDASSNESIITTAPGFFWDNSSPTGLTAPDVSTDDATNLSSPTTTWSAASDNCGFSHYEIAIGTTAGASDIQTWMNIGTILSYKVRDGIDSASFNLTDATDYYMTVRAIDNAGLYQELSSVSFQVFNPVVSLPNMVLSLDASELTSVIDSGGRDATNGSFAGDVATWNDISASTNAHNWFTLDSSPSFDAVDNHIVFSGSQGLQVANHADLNTSTVNQRNITISIETSADITSRQVIYEEGGGTRGMNIYIDAGNLYCAFWNVSDDGDGAQPFVSVSSAITASTIYHISWVFDYTNYTGGAGPDGTLECFVNKSSIGSSTTTSLLYGHSGGLGIGNSNGSTVYHDGNSSTNYFFSGNVMEVMLFNDPPTATTINTVHTYLEDKWN